jgi:hypothetical protein
MNTLPKLLHDLNNKACAVLGMFELIDQKLLTPEAINAFLVIKRNLDEMRSILFKINCEYYKQSPDQAPE